MRTKFKLLFPSFSGLAKHVLTLILSFIFLLQAGLPSYAVDARQPKAGLLPIRATVVAPPGASNLCNAYKWACAKGGQFVIVDDEAMTIVNQINREANRKIRSVSDLQQYRTAERWALPTKRGGDCEDYALYKKLELLRAGFSAGQLLIATALDLEGGSHAVLILRTGNQDLVLDNLTNSIKSWRRTGYTFLRLQNPGNPQQWVSVLAGRIFDKAS